ncbi:MAG: EscE/YscE/SsaE family type III secretion system needle protein co-chaperone [Puniceicoccales bacterium]|nr:EscE/YscE/SsaE family type III secretion system needle protein co-chaperone [Puniceicoccales bacterium]
MPGDLKKIALVPLELELCSPSRRREVLDKLMAGLGRINQILLGGLDPKRFAAYESLKKSFLAAIFVIKNFRG